MKTVLRTAFFSTLGESDSHGVGETNGEGDKSSLNDAFQTELVDAGGRDVKVCSWLKKATCVEVGCESMSDWNAPTELINIQKVCSDVSVPPMKLLKYEAGNPPGRRFQLDPKGVEFKAPQRDEQSKKVKRLEVNSNP